MSLPGSWELTEVPNKLFPVEILFRTEFSYFGSLWIWKPSLDHQMSVEHMVGNLLGTTEEVVSETLAPGSVEASCPMVEVTRKVNTKSNNTTQDTSPCCAHSGTGKRLENEWRACEMLHLLEYLGSGFQGGYLPAEH